MDAHPLCAPEETLAASSLSPENKNERREIMHRPSILDKQRLGFYVK